MAEDLRARVKAVLAREWGVAVSAIPDDAALNDYAPWDSLGHISVMMALEAEFGLELSAETVQALLSLPKIVAHLEARRGAGRP